MGFFSGNRWNALEVKGRICFRNVLVVSLGIKFNDMIKEYELPQNSFAPWETASPSFFTQTIEAAKTNLPDPNTFTDGYHYRLPIDNQTYFEYIKVNCRYRNSRTGKTCDFSLWQFERMGRF